MGRENVLNELPSVGYQWLGGLEKLEPVTKEAQTDDRRRHSIVERN